MKYEVVEWWGKNSKKIGWAAMILEVGKQPYPLRNGDSVVFPTKEEAKLAGENHVNGKKIGDVWNKFI